MRDLGLELNVAAGFFEMAQEHQYLLVHVPAERVSEMESVFSAVVRRCYVSDEALERAHSVATASIRELLQARLPDKGSVMSGDFGEILAAILQAVRETPADVLDPMKLRLKQDRTKPAPHSDVVQFVVPDWPRSTESDRVLCAEVKTKATKGSFSPIQRAIVDSKKDREGRLIKTLLWLRERSLYESLGSVSLEHLERFINAIDHPPAEHRFSAVAVVSSELVDGEIAGFDASNGGECILIVVSVPDLKNTYEAVYEAIIANADSTGDAR